ncbi:unnamed protein product [Lepeophtheirus salmonis]|uniref:(salmon louse) hypothetical protein n=1 Tax=Lepeophtheirus salmonis TaxID=72036 RepID=A0A7R8D0J6_LEPSM|nr:unnamed protein product [Lepeophtheirus salmonis]CAF2983315.1 unnamed protein product [Lepeophtheirus salmonis]
MKLSVIVPIEGCNCSRTYSGSYYDWLSGKSHYNQIITLYRETTCSETAWRRGNGQQVMAYSFYINPGAISTERSLHYIQGIEANIISLKQYFPGWIMRLYYDLDKTKPSFKSLSRNVSSMLGMVWRFLPTLDPQVDLMGSRDLDSLFSEREVAAVHEWMHSDKILHAMRDHPQHGTEILGGLWETNLTGVKSRSLWRRSWRAILLDPSVWVGVSHRNHDQHLLSKHVWNNWGRDNVLHHDSYLCRIYLNATPWPLQRKKRSK